MIKYVKKIFFFFLLLNFFIISPIFLSHIYAEDSHKTVRIGYYRCETRFQDGFSNDARKSGYAYEYYQKLSTLTGWNYEYIYGTRTEIFDKLISGEVDIIAGIYQTEKRTGQVLFSENDMGLEGEERFFALNTKRTDLLEELNHAQNKILKSTPDFVPELRQKYYSQNSQNHILTDSELEWLSNKGTLNFGYIRHNLPLSDQSENGEPVGVAAELLASISDFLKIPLNPICYDNITLMEEGLYNGEIDAAFPLYSDLWLTEKRGFYQTDAFISDRSMIVYLGDYRNDLTEKIALSNTYVGQRYFVSTFYPDSETINCASLLDSFKALEQGEANCIIGSSSILQRFLGEHSEYQDYHVAYLDTSEDFGICIKREKTPLLEIMDKAVFHLDSVAINSALIQYSNVQKPYTFMDFIRRYALVVIGVFGLFFTILLWIFINFHRKTRIFNVEQAKMRDALEDALNAANMASKAKSSFLSSMSHDIRTPMNGIIGMTAIATAHLDNPDRVADCLEKITVSGNHLLALINEILDMSKIESGEIYLDEEAFELSELINDLLILNKPLADAKQHHMDIHIMHISHEEVVGDKLRLQQVFTNLVSNAIKYTPDGGNIRISLEEKTSGNPKQACYQLIVEDNGIGMSDEFQPHIFEVFTRADDTYKNTVRGTGLGMAITHNIINMMNGDIKVESTLGKGSKFTVTFFLKLAESENIDHHNFAGLDVLVVDDDPISCESACIHLTDLDMNGEWVLSSKEAVERIEMRHKNGNDYFAVLIDWKMPDMDGLDTIKEIRSRTGNDIPIIVISGHDWSVIETEAKQAGVYTFIQKPLFKSYLVHLFDKLLGNENETPPANIKTLTEQVDLTGKRALLAEDNDINAEIAIEILEMMGITVERAENGKEAVTMMAAAKTGYYDCIFMDIQMPVMNGLDATKEIRNLPNDDAKTIPIFAMTANAFTDDVQAALNAGMNEHIAKPIHFETLVHILNDYLG